MIKLVSPGLMLIGESRVPPGIAKDAPLVAKNETGTGAMSLSDDKIKIGRIKVSATKKPPMKSNRAGG